MMRKIIQLFCLVCIFSSLTGCNTTVDLYYSYANEMNDFITEFNVASNSNESALQIIQNTDFTMEDQMNYVTSINKLCEVIGLLVEMTPPEDLEDDHNEFVGYSFEVIANMNLLAEVFEENLVEASDARLEEIAEIVYAIGEEHEILTLKFSSKGNDLSQKILEVLQ